ncbi:MAG: hypothetical protein L3J35_06850 [Bacteroidales bacterium]|nr:hypothetical protein [Bacteroidales bacterium]
MRYLFSVIFFFMFSACATQYMPSGSFVPLMQQKKDLKAKISLSTNSFQTAVAYAPFKNIAFKADARFTYNYITGLGSDDFGFIDWFFEIPSLAYNSSFEISAGYFNKINNKFIYEIYTGVKTGNSKSHYNDGKYYSPNFNFVFSTSGKKMNIGSYIKIYHNNYKIPKTYYSGETFIYNFNFFSFEPGIFLKLGKNLKTEFQIAGMFPDKDKMILIGTDYFETVEYSKLHISVGLSYNFNYKNKKQ